MRQLDDDGRYSVVRVRTLATLTHPEIKDLIWRALSKLRYPGTDSGSFYRELQVRIGEDGLGVFIGFEFGTPKTLCIGVLPSSAMMMAPQISLVYSDGTPEMICHVSIRVREWIKAEGYGEALGVNLYRDSEELEGRIGKRNDLAFQRGFRHFGQPEVAGAMIRFRF